MKMKRRFTALLTLLLAVSLTACEKKPTFDTSPEFHPETDFQYANFSFSNMIAESPNGFYYFDTHYLRFAEKSTLETVSVCGKPNCTIHEKEEYRNGITVSVVQECGAFVLQGLKKHVFYYEGSLYCVEEQIDPVTTETIFQLISLSLDGSQRKNLFELQWEKSIQQPIPGNYALHRGRFYYIVGDQETDPQREYDLYCYDLKSKQITLLYEFTGTPQRLSAVGNQIYLQTTTIGDDQMQRAMYRHTISTGAWETLPEEYEQVFPTDRELLFLCLSPDESERWLVITDREGKDPRRAELPVNSYLCAVNEDYYCFFHDDGTIELFDRTTSASAGSIPAPVKYHPRTILRFSGNKLIYFGPTQDPLGLAVLSADLSKLGSEEFVWEPRVLEQ